MATKIAKKSKTKKQSIVIVRTLETRCIRFHLHITQVHRRLAFRAEIYNTMGKISYSDAGEPRPGSVQYAEDTRTLDHGRSHQRIFDT